MNKAQLVDALTTRLGDRRTASDAVDAMVDVIVDTVGSGGSVTLTGFGVFEPRRRAPRTARNPRTGDTVPVAETVVPSFRPGAAFKERVAGSEAAARTATSAPRRPRGVRGSSTDDSARPAVATSSRSTKKSSGTRKTATKKSVPAGAGADAPAKSTARRAARATEK